MEKKTTAWRYVGKFLLKVIGILAGVLVLAALGMYFFPNLTELQDGIRHGWGYFLSFRIVCYVALGIAFFKTRPQWGEHWHKVGRMAIILVIVVEFANMTQLMRG